MRMQTVNDSLPMSSPATRSNSTSTATTSFLTTVGGRRPEGPLPGHRPTRSQQQSEAPEDPAPYTSTGSPAPVCSDVAGRLEHSHPQGRRFKIANGYTSCTLEPQVLSSSWQPAPDGGAADLRLRARRPFVKSSTTGWTPGPPCHGDQRERSGGSPGRVAALADN